MLILALFCQVCKSDRRLHSPEKLFGCFRYVVRGLHGVDRQVFYHRVSDCSAVVVVYCQGWHDSSPAYDGFLASMDLAIRNGHFRAVLKFLATFVLSADPKGQPPFDAADMALSM